MRIPCLWLVVSALLLIPSAARADDHRARAYAALSNAYRSALGGFYASGEVTVPKPWDRDLSVLADFGAYWGSHDDNDLRHITFMVGPGWTIPPGENQKHLVSVHALLGLVNTDDELNIEDGTDFAFALGVGWEFVPGRSEKKEGLGMRTQFDIVVRPGDEGNFPRLSVGAVYRFKH